MKVSIITVCLNMAETIEETIRSVLSQDHDDVEYIVIDGGSTDGTLDIIDRYKDQIDIFVTEPDKGLYDAMNKGLRKATGDVVGILNADDIFITNSGISNMLNHMSDDVDLVWGDVVYVDDQGSVVRRWRSSPYDKRSFYRGWMPPHPTMFVRRSLYERYGYLQSDMKIAADYELSLRLLEKNHCNGLYVPGTIVKMRSGGTGSQNLQSYIRGVVECYKAWRMNDLRVNPLRILILKPLSKLLQFRARR